MCLLYVVLYVVLYLRAGVLKEDDGLACGVHGHCVVMGAADLIEADVGEGLQGVQSVRAHE